MTPALSDEALAAIEARAVAATPDAVTYSYEGLTRGENPRHQFSICNGTWEDEPTRPHRCIAMVYSDSEDSAPDAEFYANARRDVLTLLAHVRRLRAEHAAEVAAAVAGERERCAAVCRDIASATPYDDAAQAWCDACAEAIDALTAPAATTGGA